MGNSEFIARYSPKIIKTVIRNNPEIFVLPREFALGKALRKPFNPKADQFLSVLNRRCLYV